MRSRHHMALTLASALLATGAIVPELLPPEPRRPEDDKPGTDAHRGKTHVPHQGKREMERRMRQMARAEAKRSALPGSGKP